MAKTTRKTDTTNAEKKPAARRAKAAPAAGAEKATARRRTKTAAAVQPTGQGAAQEPTHDEIALRAWSIYLERGASHGQATSDWLEARTQLCLERGIKP